MSEICKLVLLCVALVLANLYTQLKAIATSVHLPMVAAGGLFAGAAAVIALIMCARWSGWSLRKALPLTPLLFVLFCFPALKCWSFGSADDFEQYIANNQAWYGLLWGQLLILFTAAGFSFFAYKLANE